ncbi:MAG: hypothetical protein E7513_04070 [Ruminococcaceae bacterium]|nr:hypothetical protein [Oscillospiraceae bacterium]
MKRLVALLLTILVMVSLSACTMGTDGTKLNQDPSAATEAPKVDINKFDKNFDGMQAYLKELKLISSKEADMTVTQADVIGAKKGVRYNIDAVHFVEFYEFDTKATPDEAQKVYDAIAKDGTYNVLGVEDVKGVISDSKKFVMLYPANSTYDYSEIIEEFKKF